VYEVDYFHKKLQLKYIYVVSLLHAKYKDEAGIKAENTCRLQAVVTNLCVLSTLT
jgi:hypothetical protein